MAMPEIKRVDLAHSQTIADKLREGAGLLQTMPEIASMLNIGADQIESLCDVVKSQESLIVTLRQGIIDLGGGA